MIVVNDVVRAFRGGESERVEFKSSARSDLRGAVCVVRAP